VRTKIPPLVRLCASVGMLLWRALAWSHHFTTRGGLGP